MRRSKRASPGTTSDMPGEESAGTAKSREHRIRRDGCEKGTFEHSVGEPGKSASARELTPKRTPPALLGPILAPEAARRGVTHRTTYHEPTPSDEVPQADMPSKRLPARLRRVPCVLAFEHEQQRRGDEAPATDHLRRPEEDVGDGERGVERVAWNDARQAGAEMDSGQDRPKSEERWSLMRRSSKNGRRCQEPMTSTISSSPLLSSELHWATRAGNAQCFSHWTHMVATQNIVAAKS